MTAAVSIATKVRKGLGTGAFRVVRGGILIAFSINLILLSIDMNRRPGCVDRFSQIDVGMSRQQAAAILRGRSIKGAGSTLWEFADSARYYHLHFDEQRGTVVKKCFGFRVRRMFFVRPGQVW